MNEAIRVRERPILFSAAMVAAILEGRKTQTRRVIKPQPPKGFSDPMPAFNSGWCWLKGYGPNGEEWPDGINGLSCPLGHVGEHLWVKESWRTVAYFDKCSPSQIADQCLEAGYEQIWCPVQYADGTRNHHWIKGEEPGRKRNALHMPRWASRITLEIVEVRAQRLQDIDEEDAMTNSPWVWAIEFRRLS